MCTAVFVSSPAPVYRFPGSGSFLQVVPLPWLAVACFSAVELATNAYVVENENFKHLTQR